MPNTTSSLENFDFLHLLRMLADGEKTGVLNVIRDDGTFQCWLEGGKVRHLQFSAQVGIKALSHLLQNPQGRFQFDEGKRHPSPDLNATLDAVATEALNDLPLRPLPFIGPARFASPERVEALSWTSDEQKVLRRIEMQTTLGDLSADPVARRVISRLSYLGLLKPRKSRVARLTVGMTREVRGVVLVDDLIFRRWKEDLVRHPQLLAIKDDAGNTYTFPLREGRGLGTQLLLPPDLMMQTGLRAGESVLVKPV